MSPTPDQSEEWYETFEHVLATGEPIRFERELDDRGRILDLFAFPVDEQFPRRIAIIFNDVTERVEATNRLRENAATILEADHHKDNGGQWIW